MWVQTVKNYHLFACWSQKSCLLVILIQKHLRCILETLENISKSLTKVSNRGVTNLQVGITFFCKEFTQQRIYWAKGAILNFLEKIFFWCLEGSKTVFPKKRENSWFYDFGVFLRIIRYISGIVELMLGFFWGKSLKCVFSKSKSIWPENTSKFIFWAQKFDF